MVLEPWWTLGLVEIAQVQVERVDFYYPSLATCGFVLRSNLTAQAFGRLGSKMKMTATTTRPVTARDRDSHRVLV